MARRKKTNKIQEVADVSEMVAEVNAKLETLREEQSKVADTAMGMLKSLINKTSYITAIRWQQYTPSFNDGDVCEFGIQDVEFLFDDSFHGRPSKAKSKDDEDDEIDDSGFVSSYMIDEEFFLKKKDILNYKDVDVIEEVASAICEIHSELSNSSGILEAKFGDDVQITVTKKGVETEEYTDHE